MDNEVSKHSQDGSYDSTYSLLDIGARLASGEVRAAAGGERRGLGDDLRAVDERALVDTEETEAAKDIGERLLEFLLVVRERLPLASSARVTSELSTEPLSTDLCAPQYKQHAPNGQTAT